MKIALTSDTHRGYSKNTSKIHEKWGAKLAGENFDVLVLAGDLGSHKTVHFAKALKFFRGVAGKRPIVCVRGNHDFWDTQRPSLRLTLSKQEEAAVLHDVTLLDGGRTLRRGVVTFVGWDGWYAHKPCNANDTNFLPSFSEGSFTWPWLQRHAHQGFTAALDAAKAAADEGQTVVAVTHFPIIRGLTKELYDGNYSYWPPLAQHVTALMYGHSHLADHREVDGALVLNCGSDYDRPKYTVIDLTSAT